MNGFVATQSLKDLIFQQATKPLYKEFLYGLLCLLVLYLPFVLAIMAAMWLLHGVDMFIAFETDFYNPNDGLLFEPILSLILGFIVNVSFAPLNAPIENLFTGDQCKDYLFKPKVSGLP